MGGPHLRPQVAVLLLRRVSCLLQCRDPFLHAFVANGRRRVVAAHKRQCEEGSPHEGGSNAHVPAPLLLTPAITTTRRSAQIGQGPTPQGATPAALLPGCRAGELTGRPSRSERCYPASARERRLTAYIAQSACASKV